MTGASILPVIIATVIMAIALNFLDLAVAGSLGAVHSVLLIFAAFRQGYPRSPDRTALALAEPRRERFIGSIRRESLEHLIVFDEARLRRFLKNYAAYCNQVRAHLSLDKNAPQPDFRRPQSQRYQSSADSITNTSGFIF
jgi:hypothetical protein